MRWWMVWIIVASTVIADLLQSSEMKRKAVAAEDLRPSRWGRVLANIAQRGPLVLAVFFMAVSFPKSDVHIPKAAREKQVVSLGKPYGRPGKT